MGLLGDRSSSLICGFNWIVFELSIRMTVVLVQNVWHHSLLSATKRYNRVSIFSFVLYEQSLVSFTFRLMYIFSPDLSLLDTVYPKKYAHGFVVLCFVVVMQSFIVNSHEVFIHIHRGCFAGTGAIVRLPQCQWSKPDGYGKISQYITTTKHSKAKTVCIFLGIYCIYQRMFK